VVQALLSPGRSLPPYSPGSTRKSRLTTDDGALISRDYRVVS